MLSIAGLARHVMRTLQPTKFIMSHPVSELFLCKRISIHVTCSVVFPSFLLYFSSQDPQEVFSSTIWFLFILKESVAFHCLWKQKSPQCNTFPDFHPEAKTSLKYIAWFNSAFHYTIQSLSAAAVCSSILKKFSRQSNIIGFRLPHKTMLTWLFKKITLHFL